MLERLRGAARDGYLTVRGPSFYLKLMELRRVYRMAQATPSEHVWGWETKVGGRRVAEQSGFATPKLLRPPALPEDLQWGGLPDEFVIKPVDGTGSKGVFLVRREGSRFRNLADGTTLDVDDIVGELRQLARDENSSIGREVVVEELVSGFGSKGLPFDWKFYCFQGVVEMVIQYDRGRGHCRYYGSNWEDLGELRSRYKWIRDPGLQPPRDPAGLASVAAALSEKVPLPFIRVDLYESRIGAVFGELSVAPGGVQKFGRGWDQRLGKAWERGAARAMRLSA